MTLLQIRNIIDYILSLGEGKIRLTKERFTDILTIANLQYFEEQVRQKNWDNLRPFTKIKGGHESAPLTVTNGIMTYPSDFYQPISAKAMIAQGTSFIYRPIEKVNHEMFDERESNPVTRPTTRYPVINYQDGYARVRPVAIKKVYFTYLTLPVAPLYAQKIQGGVNVYDSANSVQLEWTDDCQVDVMRIALQQLGIKVGRSDIFQAIEAQENKERQLTV